MFLLRCMSLKLSLKDHWWRRKHKAYSHFNCIETTMLLCCYLIINYISMRKHPNCCLKTYILCFWFHMRFLEQRFHPRHNAKMGHIFYQEFLWFVLLQPKKKIYDQRLRFWSLKTKLPHGWLGIFHTRQQWFQHTHSSFLHTNLHADWEWVILDYFSCLINVKLEI